MTSLSVALAALSLATASPDASAGSSRKGKLLSELTWVEARAALTPETVVVIPLGAGSKEHGPHLPLGADFMQAEYYKGRALAQVDAVFTPTLNFSYYPAFVEYPGNTSLELSVARELVLNVVHGLAKFGPKRFYVINIGVSTNKPLSEAAAVLALEGISLRYLDLVGPTVDALDSKVRTEKEGSHADEVETSEMLAIAPNLVDMHKAAADFPSMAAPGPLSLDPKNPKYSASGIYGDARLATPAKGKLLVDGLTAIIVSEIEALRRAPLPTPLNIRGRLATPAPKPAEPASPAAH